MPVTQDELHEAIVKHTRQALKDAGGDFDFWVRELMAEVKATTTKFFQKDGIVTDEREVIDWNTRQGALKIALMLGAWIPSQRTDDQAGTTIIYNLYEPNKPEGAGET